MLNLARMARERPGEDELVPLATRDYLAKKLTLAQLLTLSDAERLEVRRLLRWSTQHLRPAVRDFLTTYGDDFGGGERL